MSQNEKVLVNKRSLEKMIGKLTYPKFCRHACGDSAVCLLCHAVWEERAMSIRQGIITMLRVSCKEQGIAGYPKKEPKR